MKCNLCNCVLEDDALYCPDCGARVYKEISYNKSARCLICDSECDGDSKYCDACFAKMAEENAKEVLGDETEETETANVEKNCPSCGNICGNNDKFCPACGYNFITGNSANGVIGESLVKKINDSKIVGALKNDFSGSETIDVIRDSLSKSKIKIDKKLLVIILVIVVIVLVWNYLSNNLVTCDYCDGVFWRDDIYQIFGEYVCEDCFS